MKYDTRLAEISLKTRNAVRHRFASDTHTEKAVGNISANDNASEGVFTNLTDHTRFDLVLQTTLLADLMKRS